MGIGVIPSVHLCAYMSTYLGIFTDALGRLNLGLFFIPHNIDVNIL